MKYLPDTRCCLLDSQAMHLSCALVPGMATPSTPGVPVFEELPVGVTGDNAYKAWTVSGP